jgi:hypothetical protein
MFRSRLLKINVSYAIQLVGASNIAKLVDITIITTLILKGARSSQWSLIIGKPIVQVKVGQYLLNKNVKPIT